MVLKAFDSQFKKTITYTGLDGKEQKLEATLQEPGTKNSMMLKNMAVSSNDTSRWSDIVELLLKTAIVSPNYNFETLNKDLPEELKTKKVEAINADKKKVTLVMEFPDYRTAFDLVNSFYKPSGALNAVDTLENLNKEVFKDSKGNAVDWDYWDNEAHGLAEAAVNEAIKYILGVLNKDGLYSLIMYTFQKTQTSISIKGE